MEGVGRAVGGGVLLVGVAVGGSILRVEGVGLLVGCAVGHGCFSLDKNG